MSAKIIATDVCASASTATQAAISILPTEILKIALGWSSVEIHLAHEFSRGHGLIVFRTKGSDDRFAEEAIIYDIDESVVETSGTSLPVRQADIINICSALTFADADQGRMVLRDAPSIYVKACKDEIIRRVQVGLLAKATRPTGGTERAN